MRLKNKHLPSAEALIKPSGQSRLRSVRLRISIVISVLLLLIACFFVTRWVLLRSHMPFRQVEISSSGHAVAINQLQSIIDRHVNAGFFSLNMHRLQNQLLLLPWVESASIRRIWPDRLRVAIQERHAAAVWNETQLLTEDGVIFQPNLASFPTGLPTLNGPVTQESEVLGAYRHFGERLKRMGLELRSLALEDHSWHMHLASGTELFLNETEEEKQFAEFDRLYRRLLHLRMRAVSRVDLRYASGAAVLWRHHQVPAKNRRIFTKSAT